jgi:hypothetical protein
MRRIIILLLCCLFILGCTGNCLEPKVIINGKCCADSNNNSVCDLNEVSFTGGAVLDFDEEDNQTDTTTTTQPVYTDCNHTQLNVNRVIYYDGDDSRVNALVLNSGQVDIVGFRIWLYDEDGVDADKTYSENLTVNEVREIDFYFGDKDRVSEDNEVTLIQFAPQIKGETCEKINIYEFTSIDH